MTIDKLNGNSYAIPCNCTNNKTDKLEKMVFKNGIYRNLVSFQFGVGRKFDYITFAELPCAVQVDISRNVPDSQEYTSFNKSCQDLLIVGRC